ncbi:MAG: DUF2970 domain-containing protein [Burkholderiales bacterium]
MQDKVKRRNGNWQAAKAVFWSFFGVRRKVDYDADAVQLGALQVIVAGLVGALLLVLALLLLVASIT